MGFFRLSGVHVKHCKNTADVSAERIPVPKLVRIPMSMHIGVPANPIVKIGDAVKVGQLIGEAGSGLSVPVYSSVSGTVKKIDNMLNVAGGQIQTIVVESDGLHTVDDSVIPYNVNTREEFLAALSKSGIVGLGGAGFPTLIKLNADVAKIDTLLINGAECEPYITSDTRTMTDDVDALVDGIKLIMQFLGIGRAVVAIEKNKPECIRTVRKAIAGINGVSVKSLPSLYPQGGEKVLTYHALGRIIKEGMLPVDCGVIVMNCTTVAAVSKFIHTGMPLVEKCITVDGSAIRQPKNVIAPIGTPIIDIAEFCGGFKEPPRKVLYGGPMMGIALPDLDAPVLKQTNAILVFGQKEATPPPVTPCIKCGKCTEHCPFGLDPSAISRAYKANDPETLNKLKVNLCMECGCCSYVCPAKRNIVQRNKMAKTMLKNYLAEKKKREESEKNG